MRNPHRINGKNIISSLIVATIAVTIGAFGIQAVSADEGKNIDRLPINMSETSFVYNGAEQYPEVSIDGLTVDKDYSVEYTKSGEVGTVEPGEYNVVVTGINDGTNGYSGTVVRSFSINKYAYRVFGASRIETSLKTADVLRNGGKFDTVVLAYSQNYPDALAGSFLAIEKNAPILLIDDNYSAKVIDYLKSNLVAGGRVYILGAEGVISTDIEDSINENGFKVKRLGGSTRYETNLKILNEGSNAAKKPIIVCSGLGFADSLSASTSGAPILLVDPDNGLNDAQKKYLKNSGVSKIIICGGDMAVPEAVEKELAAFGEVDRLAGETRYETSKIVAEEFTDPEATTVFIAYGENFPDGLCAGPLASKMNAALLLVDNSNTGFAAEYVSDQSIGISYVMGGTAIISDEAVLKITGAQTVEIK